MHLICSLLSIICSSSLLVFQHLPFPPARAAAHQQAAGMYTAEIAASWLLAGRYCCCCFSGVRGKMVSLVPKSIMLATAGGIGLFLAFIGMQNSNGIGLITYNSATLVTLGKQSNVTLVMHTQQTNIWCCAVLQSFLDSLLPVIKGLSMIITLLSCLISCCRWLPSREPHLPVQHRRPQP
jgi:hypothetical protein